MGWASTIEDSEDRLNDDMHLHSGLGESQFPGTIQNTLCLCEECKAMLAEIKHIKLSLDGPSVDLAERVAKLQLELHRERLRNDNLRNQRDQERRARRSAEQKCQTYQKQVNQAEERIAQLDENGSVARKQGRTIESLRATIQHKNEEIAKLKEARPTKRRNRRPATKQQRRSKRGAKQKTSSR